MSRRLKVEKYRHDRRNTGAIYTTPDGRQAFLAHRRLQDIHRSREKTISDAARKGVAFWAIDEGTLNHMRIRGVGFIGVLCRETGDIWLAKTERWFDPQLGHGPRTTSHGARFRLLELGSFSYKTGKTKL